MKIEIALILLFCLFPSKAEVKKDENTIYLPPGVTVLHSPLVLRSGQSLIGDNSTLFLADNSNCPVVVAGSDEDFPAASRDIFIYGIEIDGNKDNQEFEIEKRGHIRNNGISVRNGDNVIVSNVKVRNCRSGGLVLERGSRRVSILDSKFSQNYFDGVAGYESEGCVLHNLDISDNNAAGISLDLNFNRNTITASNISGNKKEGIFMRHSNLNQFSRLSVMHNGGDSIFMARSELPDSGANFNTFSDIWFLGNGEGMQVGDGCEGNLFLRSVFGEERFALAISP